MLKIKNRITEKIIRRILLIILFSTPMFVYGNNNIDSFINSKWKILSHTPEPWNEEMGEYFFKFNRNTKKVIIEYINKENSYTKELHWQIMDTNEIWIYYEYKNQLYFVIQKNEDGYKIISPAMKYLIFDNLIELDY